MAIASALLAGKEILVFDEPTSGLDFRHMEQTANLISSLQGKQTVLIVTHDPELISVDRHSSYGSFMVHNDSSPLRLIGKD